MAKVPQSVTIEFDLNWDRVIAGLELIANAARECGRTMDELAAALKEADSESGTRDNGAGRGAAHPEADRLTHG